MAVVEPLGMLRFPGWTDGVHGMALNCVYSSGERTAPRWPCVPPPLREKMVVALRWQVRWTEAMSSNVGGLLVVGIGSKREVISSTVRDSWALDAMETVLKVLPWSP